MKTVLLNGKRMTNKKELHLYLKRKLGFPDYYGKNLDALWDLLSTISDSMGIILFNKEYIEEFLGDYGNSLIKVFQESSESNEKIVFKIVDIKQRN